MLVVGLAELVELAPARRGRASAPAAAPLLVEDAPDDPAGSCCSACAAVGVTAGASAPEALVEARRPVRSGGLGARDRQRAHAWRPRTCTSSCRPRSPQRRYS